MVFTDPKGTEVELFTEAKLIGNQPVGGVAPLKLGHIACLVPDAKAISEFYIKALGFRVSDWIEDYFAFLRCGPDHHTLNFITGDGNFMHHFAFQLNDWGHLQKACDVLAQHKRPLIWGPGRHGVGHNVFVYHRDPDDHIIELFAEMDQMNDESLGFFEPRPWHHDRPQRPKGMGTQVCRNDLGPAADGRFPAQPVAHGALNAVSSEPAEQEAIVTERIGFIGLGRMGSAMVKRMCETGARSDDLESRSLQGDCACVAAAARRRNAAGTGRRMRPHPCLRARRRLRRERAVWGEWRVARR